MMFINKGVEWSFSRLFPENPTDIQIILMVVAIFAVTLLSGLMMYKQEQKPDEQSKH